MNKKFLVNLLHNPLFSGSFLMVGGGMVVNAVNYLYHLIMGRVLGPSDYGVLASLYSILYITSTVPVSTSVAIVKFISSAKDVNERVAIYNSIKRFILLLSLGLGIFIVLLSGVISKFLNISSFLEVALIGPVIFFSLMTLVNQSTLQGVLNFFGVVGPNFVSALGKFFLGLIFVYLGFSVLGAMWGVLIGAVFAYLLSLKLIKKVVSHKTNQSFALNVFFKYSLPVLLQALAFTSFFTTDVILVKHFFSPFDAGLYAALSTLGKIIFFAASPLTAVMFPVVSKRSSRGERYNKIFLTAVALTAAVSFGIVILYFIFPDYAIGILYGEKYLGAKANLVWMGLFISIYSLAYLFTNFFLSIGKTKITYLPVIFAIIQVVAIWFYHQNILQVIQISLTIMFSLLLTLCLYLGYNSFYAEKRV